MSTGLEPTITLTDEGEWWVAKDVETGVASQGTTREAALENLDEAVALYKQNVDAELPSDEEERAALKDLGFDPDAIEAARSKADDLPEFMQ